MSLNRNHNYLCSELKDSAKNTYLLTCCSGAAFFSLDIFPDLSVVVLLTRCHCEKKKSLGDSDVICFVPVTVSPLLVTVSTEPGTHRACGGPHMSPSPWVCSGV